MIVDHKKYELFVKAVLQKVVLKPPFKFTFPITDNACFLYMLEGETQLLKLHHIPGHLLNQITK